MQIDTGPTRLRRLHPTDLKDFLAYRRDPQVAQYQSWPAMSDVEAARFISWCAEVSPLLRPGEWTQIAVAATESDALLGDMGWHLSDDTHEVELGITLAQHAQGLGHATRAMQSAVEYVFRKSAVARIVAYADMRNAPSRALLRRAGFSALGEQVYEGVLEEVFEFRRPGAVD